VVGPGESVRVSYAQAVPTGNDWIRLYPAGQTDDRYDYARQPAPGNAGTLTFAPPRSPGAWEFRLYHNGVRIATSNAIIFFNGWQLITGAAGGTTSPIALDAPRHWYVAGRQLSGAIQLLAAAYGGATPGVEVVAPTPMGPRLPFALSPALAKWSMPVTVSSIPLVDSPGIVVKPMSSLFRSSSNRASVASEGEVDGWIAWRRVRPLADRAGHRGTRRELGPCCRTYSIARRRRV
jgi:hypothetical protein